MKILVAPDSYKGSLTAEEVANGIRDGIQLWNPHADAITLPLSDGGEGFTQTIMRKMEGEWVLVKVLDPLTRPIDATFGWIEEERTAIIDVASASGLTLLAPDERNPLIATSYGTGQLILEALKRGSEKIIIGLGGSGVNDGGIGMAQALGYRFFDSNGKEIPVGGKKWLDITHIDSSTVVPHIFQCTFICASDVDNPLCGPRGAPRVFGPQKGATPEMVPLLDKGLENLASVIKKDLNQDILNIPGGGAAGGLGAGLVAFCNAEIQKGIDFILDLLDFDELVKQVDIVITGEGCTDEQTLHGKVVSGVAKRAAAFNKPVLCISGSLKGDYEKLRNFGVAAFFSILRETMSLEEALSKENAYNALVSVTKEIFYVLSINEATKNTGTK